MPEKVLSDQVYTACHLSNKFLDTSTDSKMDIANIKNGKILWFCLSSLFNDTLILVGHFESSPRDGEKGQKS